MPLTPEQRYELDRRFGDHRVFIQIAAYRDRDLVNTVRSAIDHAAEPARLRFGICLQYDAETLDSLRDWDDDPRVEVAAIPWDEGKGVGWARSIAQSFYDSEPYLLQVDSHVRFADGWDTKYVSMLHAADSERPILTNYPLMLTFGDDGSEEYEQIEDLRKLGFEPSRPEWSLRQRSEPAPLAATPQRHGLLAAGNLFTLGCFCVDVPYDPEIYYEGEEISLAARAYTHGYDLFYPNEHLVWHHYNHGGPTHWNDHDGCSQREVGTIRKVAAQLRGEQVGERFGLGVIRSAGGFSHLLGMELPPDGYDNVE
jgi:hypothetical protein